MTVEACVNRCPFLQYMFGSMLGGCHNILLSGQFCKTTEDSTYILILLIVVKELKSKCKAGELKMFEKYNQEQRCE